MTRIVEQNELGFDVGLRDTDEPDTKVRIPTALHWRARIKEDRSPFPVDQGFVAVAKHDQIDPGMGSCPRSFQRRFAVMSMQQEHGAGARLDPNSVRECLDEIVGVGIATHGNGRGYLLQSFQDRGVTGVSGMQDEADVHSAKEFDYLL